MNSFQIKFNLDYYPPQPIIGNAGCPEMVDTTGDNRDFLEQILVSNNYLFSANYPNPKINAFNFALNRRIYDPSVAGALYNGTNVNQGTIPTINNMDGLINPHTAMGQSYFHENRHRGTAAFCFSFEPYAHSKNYMIGVDTRNVRPFDVLFDTVPTGLFPTDQTLYIYCKNHILVTYGTNGV